MAKGKQRQRGMTLLEVMVALAIFSTAAIALMNSVSINVRFTHSLGDTLQAGWVAENQLAEAALAKTDFPEVAEEGRETMGGRTWLWRKQRVNSGEKGSMNEISVFTEEANSQPVLSLQIAIAGGSDETPRR